MFYEFRCSNPRYNPVYPGPNIDYTYTPADYDADITGFWGSRYRFGASFEPQPIPHTPESRAIIENRVFGDDRSLRCMSAGLARVLASPAPREISDAGTHYLMLSLRENTPRWVWMVGRTAPADHPLTSMGFSVGRWESRTLIIETSHLFGAKENERNVPNYFASLGLVGVNMTYRLAPDATFPDGAQDVAAAVTWVRENIADYGGDPEQIFIIGKSAGVEHVAGYVFRPELLPPGTPRSCQATITTRRT